jgi:O-glycosyl hydrolase
MSYSIQQTRRFARQYKNCMTTRLRMLMPLSKKLANNLLVLYFLQHGRTKNCVDASLITFTL